MLALESSSERLKNYSLTGHLYYAILLPMISINDFALILTKRNKRKHPYSKSYIFWLIRGGKIQPPPQKIGSGKGMYVIDDDAKVIK